MKIFFSSAVIAAIIAAIVSLIVTKIEYRNSLKLSRMGEKVRLLSEHFDTFREKLTEINFISPQMNGDVDHDRRMMRAALWDAANEKRKLIFSTISRVTFLLPPQQVKTLRDKYNELEECHMSLTYSARIATGDYEPPVNDHTEIEVIPAEKIDSKMDNYIADVDKAVNALEEQLERTLREIFRTTASKKGV